MINKAKSTQELLQNLKELRNRKTKDGEDWRIKSEKAYAQAESLQDAIYELEDLISYQDKENKPITDKNNIKNIQFDTIYTQVKKILTTQAEHTDPLTAWTYNNILNQLNKNCHIEPVYLNAVLEYMIEKGIIEDISKQVPPYQITSGIFQWIIK